MESNLTPSELLRYLTVQINTAITDGGPWTGSGTGFNFGFLKGDNAAPLIITNKHVLQGAAMISLRLHEQRSDGGPKMGAGRRVEFRSSDVPIILHPDPAVDLAAIAMASVHRMIETQFDWKPYLHGVGPNVIPNADQWNQFGTMEDVIMAGYPTGLANLANNLPIIRRGITATPCGSDYQGQREFLIDMAVFPGSSGSPVMIINEGSFSTPSGLALGTRFHLLGILYAGHYQTATGEVVAAPAPTAIASIAKINQMIHLGICVKSTRILELEGLLPDW